MNWIWLPSGCGFCLEDAVIFTRKTIHMRNGIAFQIHDDIDLVYLNELFRALGA